MRVTMPNVGPEEKFRQQAAKGSGHWRRQRAVALAAASLFAIGSVYALWRAWRNTAADLSDIFGILSFLAAAVAAGMWQVHAEMMQGAATYLERQAAAAASNR